MEPEELRRELSFLKESEKRYADALAHLTCVLAASGAVVGKKSDGKSTLTGYVRNRVKQIEQFQGSEHAAASSRERLFAAIKHSKDGEDPIEAEMMQLAQRLQIAKQRRLAAQDRRVELAKKMHEARLLRDELERRVNLLATQCAASVEDLRAVKEDLTSTATQLHKFTEISVINDAFYIWFSGPFATINNFRLGNSPVGRQVEWMEINAALGQAMMVVSIIASRAGLRFRQYTLHPFGSFSKVSTKDDRRVLYNLFMDPTLFSLFPKSKFHPAMFGFLCCVKELGDYIGEHGTFWFSTLLACSEGLRMPLLLNRRLIPILTPQLPQTEFIRRADPPLSMPYHLELEEGRPPRIGSRSGSELLELYRGSDDLSWTRALKFLLSDIKWMIAWSTKHTIRLEGRESFMAE